MRQYTEIYNTTRVVSPAFGKQLQDYQKMVRNFMSLHSGHDKLFIWHSTGRGKTVSTISITEPFSKLLIESPELDGYIYIVGSYASNENFINELIGDVGNSINHIDPESDGIYITKNEKKELKSMLYKVGNDPKAALQYNQYYKRYIISRLTDARYKFYTYQKFLNLPITNIDNSLIVVDEAHNMLNTNEYSQMMRTLINNSKNYKVLLLSATPMFNSPHDIVDFCNLMFKKEEELIKSKVFAPGGFDYLAEKMKGKISFLTSQHDSNFPAKIDIGEIPPYLKETKIIRVIMSNKQIKEYKGLWDGLMTPEVKSVLDMATNTVDNYHISALAEVSPKYLTCLNNLNENHKTGKSMVYHSYVNGTGIKTFGEILRQNGYMEYTESYLKPETRDRVTGKTYGEDPSRFTGPVKFALLHGDIDKAERASILEIYNSRDNLFGEKISILIGSQLLRESVDLKATLHIHILGYQENYSRIDQILGRGIRYKSHMDLPEHLRYVKVYKYCSALENELSGEELEYVKDEANFIKMKEIASILKLVAIDCSQNSKYNQVNPIKCVPMIDNSLPEMYTLFYSDDEVYDCTLYILNLFLTNVVLDYDSIISMVPFDKNFIHMALNRIVTKKITIPGTNGSTIIRKGMNYLLQPSTFDNPNIDINLRATTEVLAQQTDVTEQLREMAIAREATHVFNVNKVYEEIRESPEIVTIIMYKYDKYDQQLVLEDAIRKYYKSKDSIPPEVFLILKTYKRYLIDENELSADISTTSVDKYFDSNSWNKKDANRKFVGHFFSTNIRLYNPETDQFEYTTNAIFKKRRPRDLKDNPYGIGSLSRDIAGNIVFKIRDPIVGKEILDQRKIPRGYVCNRVNNKQNLYVLLDNLEVDYNPESRIADLCVKIEKTLREKQIYNNKNNLQTLWFEDLKW